MPNLKQLKKAAPWLAAVVTGLMLFASFPPLGWSGVAWISLVPLWVAVRGQSSRRAWQLGFIAGAVFWLLSISWLTKVTIIGWFLLALYCALYLAWFAWLLAHLLRRLKAGLFYTNVLLILATSFLWMGFEYIRSILFTGFPWHPLAVSQYDLPVLIQLADVGGVYLVSAVIAMCNAAVALTVFRYFESGGQWRGKMNAELMFTVVTLGMTVLYGMKAMALQRMRPCESIRVGLVQTSIPQTDKWTPELSEMIFERLDRLTRYILRLNQTDLIIWPEAALPDFMRESPRCYKFVTDLTTNGVPILVGAMDKEWMEDGPPRYYNSSFLFGKDGQLLASYDKQHLVLFGEYIPFDEKLSFINALTPIQSSFNAGSSSTVFRLPQKEARFASLICFEDTVEQLARKAVRGGAHMLVNQTNDAWFDPSCASLQHMSHCVFRCVENRVPAVRVGNTGVSCHINRWGRIKEEHGEKEMITGRHRRDFVVEGFTVLRVDVPYNPTRTFFSRRGPVFAQVSAAVLVALTLGICFHGVWARRKKGALDKSCVETEG